MDTIKGYYTNKATNNDIKRTKNEIMLNITNFELQNRKHNTILQRIAMNYFVIDGLWYYCWKWNKQCSDWSNLYTIVYDKEWSQKLIKVWAWEFNVNSFINWPEDNKDLFSFTNKNLFLHKSPVPLFVVNQADCYFADNEQKNMVENDALLYLKNYAVIISPKAGEARYEDTLFRDEKKELDLSDIEIPNIEKAILMFRNNILNQFDKNTVNIYMEKLQWFSWKELREEINVQIKKDSTEKQILDKLKSMWVLSSWISVWSELAMVSLLNLINSYDINKWEFVYIPTL